MNLNLKYIDVENFKTFGTRVHIDITNPTVLIGPNNSGKTSIIQAFALWSLGVKEWFSKKGKNLINPSSKNDEINGRNRYSTGINRLNILDVPVAETRYLWNQTKVRVGNRPIEIVINVGVEKDERLYDCRFIFTERDQEVIYCKPCKETLRYIDIIKECATISTNLLYPMSGILASVSTDTEETVYQEGRINLLLGQGQTAQVLRNICYKVCEADEHNRTNDWESISEFMYRMFLVRLAKPEFDATRGSLKLYYSKETMQLDIALAGRGLQQMLLILAYAYWRKNSVILIDEPDAHFEILRQKQAFIFIKELASRTGSIFIIATHSEVIIEESVDINLNLIIDGEVVNLAQKDDMKKSLKQYGISQYYNARVKPRMLYLEGTTDFDILRVVAKKLNHPAYEILVGRLNCYYTQNVEPNDCLDTKLALSEGLYRKEIYPHFFTLKKYVPDLKGIGIFDADNSKKDDIIQDDLIITFWSNYEIENHALSIDLIKRYVLQTEIPLMYDDRNIEQAIDAALLSYVFEGDKDQLEDFKAAKRLQKTILGSKKMSLLVELIFKRYSEILGQPILLNKGEYYKLTELLTPDEIDGEIILKLDLIHQKLKG